MNYVKDFSDWSRLFEAEQSKPNEGWDSTTLAWARSNGYAQSVGTSGLSSFMLPGSTKTQWIYSKIKNSTNPEHIAKLIFHSYAVASLVGLGMDKNDTEAVAEAAFEALAKNRGQYGKVATNLSSMISSGKKKNTWMETNIPKDMPSDPYSFCKYFMKTSTKYQGSSPSIDESYKKIQATK